MVLGPEREGVLRAVHVQLHAIKRVLRTHRRVDSNTPQVQ
jgi:hypothetical protein